MILTKLTEDGTIKLLIKHFENQGYSVVSYCLGQQRGCDIIVEKGNRNLYIEVKGAKANKNSPTNRREFFDSGQIKTHFGKAIIKALETKQKHPDSKVAIAHPCDEKIINVIGSIIPELRKLNIIHFWVKENGNVIIDK